MPEKHSPGPWKLREVCGQGPKKTRDHLVAVETRSGHILNAFNVGSEKELNTIHQDGVPMHKEEMLANYRLMAAAPDLLAACQAVVSGDFHAPFCKAMRGMHNPCDCGLELCRESVARARGES